jgi:murein DD-endopeptidase MepM/ murein hydrolase activator NlpD
MSDFCFPFTSPPSVSWRTGARYFGAPRKGTRRRHGGCDIIKPVGTVIHAVADGVLVHEETYFYSNTYYVTYQHGDILVRYGEIMRRSNGKKKGSTVKKGEPIAKVGRLASGSSMLHIEIYKKGNLHTPLRSTAMPYQRRSDVTDPAPYLDEWVKNLAPG